MLLFMTLIADEAHEPGCTCSPKCTAANDRNSGQQHTRQHVQRTRTYHAAPTRATPRHCNASALSVHATIEPQACSCSCIPPAAALSLLAPPPPRLRCTLGTAGPARTPRCACRCLGSQCTCGRRQAGRQGRQVNRHEAQQQTDRQAGRAGKSTLSESCSKRRCLATRA